MRKRKYRQAAACFLTAALVLSAGQVQSVSAETEVSSETVQQETPEEESTVTVTPGTGVSEETEPQTVPLTEQNTETETQVETETETQTESEPILQANQLLEFSDSVDEAVKSVQEQIDALPTVDELVGMEREAQQKVYDQLQTAYDAYEMLNEEEKEQIKGAEIFDDLFQVFNGITNALEAAGAFEVTGGTSGIDYSYTNGVLTVNNGANLTISTNGQTSDRIVIASGAKANITLAGVNITPTDAGTSHGYSGIDLGNGATLNLTLSDDSTNEINGGTSTTGLPGPGIHLPEGSTLTINGSGSLEVKGASGNSRAAVGIGGMGSDSENGEACGNVLILGGTIKVHGGTPKYSIGKQPVDIGGGNSDLQKGGDCNTVIILTPVNSGGGLTIGGGAGSSIGGGNGSNGQGIRPSSDGSYTVWGNLTVPSGVAFPGGITLNIPSGTILNLPEDFTWPENITVTGGGTITPDTMKVPAKITFKENLSKTATGSRIELAEGEDYSYNGNGEVSIKWFTDHNGKKGYQTYSAQEGNSYFWVEVSAQETTLYKAASTDIRIYVAKGTRGDPTVPTTLEPKAGSITVNTVSGQKYICTTDSTAPAFDAAGWIDGNGSTYTFGNLSSGKQYYVYTYAPENDYFEQSGISHVDVKTNGAAYMVTIPAQPQTMMAGDKNSTLHIAIDQNATFDIGYSGKVTVSAPAEVTLTGQEEYNKDVTLTSSLLVDGEEHQGNEIISFDQDNYTTQSAKIRFAKPVLPDGGIVPAGNYEGTITFEVSYSENTTS